MKHTPKKNPFHAFQHELDTFSTCLQQIFAFFNISLVFFVFTSKIRHLLIMSEACCHFEPPTQRPASLARSRQTESKGNFESMTLYSHKEACCHFAPPKSLVPASSHPRQKTNLLQPCFCSLSQRSVRERVGVRAACCHFAPPTRGLGVRSFLPSCRLKQMSSI
jgi:hypothetical protein